MPEAQAPPKPAEPLQSPERIQRVNEAVKKLKERGALKQDPCPQCGVFTWEVVFLATPSLELPKVDMDTLTNILRMGATSSSWVYIPVVSLTCRNCGYVMNFNLRYLGLLDLVRSEP
jgi:hypothetical protein